MCSIPIGFLKKWAEKVILKKSTYQLLLKKTTIIIYTRSRFFVTIIYVLLIFWRKRFCYIMQWPFSCLYYIIAVKRHWIIYKHSGLKAGSSMSYSKNHSITCTNSFTSLTLIETISLLATIISLPMTYVRKFWNF